MIADKTNSSRRRLLFLPVMMVVLMGILFPGPARAGQEPIKIGVLAIRGLDPCLQQWKPTAGYLAARIPGHTFLIIPLAHNQVYSMVKDGRVDFILANSAFYVGLEHLYRINRIVTLKERVNGGIHTRYGGVIFCRKDHTDIRRLTDLKGKSFMAVSEMSLGGWLMAWRELREKGIDPYTDFKELRFKETHDDVVLSVRDRLVDAGTVRTGTLEKMSAEGLIDLDDFYVFPRLHATDGPSPYLCTTREYPEWPMARVRHTSEALAEQVAVALLQMPADAPAALAGGCAGWTIPLNYQPVHECLKELRVGPYENLGEITVRDVLTAYGNYLAMACAAFIVLTVITVAIIKLNRRIRTSNVRLRVAMDLRRQQDRELKAAKELAEDAARAKSEFLANMSHEIRTPMNGVIAATELALGEDVSPKVEKYLTIVQNSAYSLLGIINDILDFSKIEAGKFELKPHPFRLGEVFDRVMELFFSKAADKGIELLVDYAPEIPKVLEGDPLRLQQILTNLISNAIKFTDAGGVILVGVAPTIAADDHRDEGEVTLSFSVKDTGTGIDPEYRNLLFEPFSQADTSSTRKYEGTGLGLSICKQLVTMMGGDIGVQSEPGRGSLFSFTVKLRQPASDSIPQPAVPADIQGATVLVVDDLADSRLLMRKMLESLTFNVETVSSGIDALSRLKANHLRSNPVELIMMDWKMPHMDGIEAARKIRREMNLTMPIIMMTAFGREEQRIQAEAVGIDGFLIKPIYPSTLFDAIMDGFGRGGAKDARSKRGFTTRASIYRKPLKGLHLLVAEDNPTNQQVAQAILEKAGIVVTIVGDGEAAVEAVGHHDFDAVLMDIQMPRMNGLEATRRIRELPRGESLPIVAMTAHAMKGDEEKCLEVGMNGYVSKPVNQDRLFHTLWRLLRTTNPALGQPAPGDEATSEIQTEMSAPDDGLPDGLPGLTIKDTLSSLSIDGATLVRIMAGFSEDNRQTGARLRQALADGDSDALRQLAHSIKGSSANIGAHALSQAARSLEDACREAEAADDDQAAWYPLIENLIGALDQVLQSIDTLTAHFYADVSGEPVAAESLENLSAALADALDTADPQAIEAIWPMFKQAARQSAGIEPRLLSALEARIERYDYDQALEAIRNIDGKQ